MTTVVTIGFPDERIRASHIHRAFDDHREAVDWVRAILDRFGSLIVEYHDVTGSYTCAQCPWTTRVRTRIRPKVAVASDGYSFLDVE